jgi:hypothetical protein
MACFHLLEAGEPAGGNVWRDRVCNFIQDLKSIFIASRELATEVGWTVLAFYGVYELWHRVSK